MSANCFATAAYVLTMKFATRTMKLPKFGMVFYNNLLGKTNNIDGMMSQHGSSPCQQLHALIGGMGPSELMCALILGQQHCRNVSFI